MRKGLKVDLDDIATIANTLAERWDVYTKEEKIDIAARMRSVKKTLEALDEQAKEFIGAKMKKKDGSMEGEIFKAVCTNVPTTRLDQKALKEGDPAVHAKYNKDVVDYRITFTPR